MRAVLEHEIKQLNTRLIRMVSSLPARAAFVLVFAGLASMLLLQSHAAPFAIGSEVESGALANSASTLSDAAASGGSAVKFAASGGGGSCPVSKRTVTAAEVAANTNSGYPAGTQLYVPGGLDPWGGCFPGAGNTGIPAGTTLSAYSGSCTITTANTIIDSKTINCSLSIQAANVTIRKSKITASDIGVDSGSLTLEDSEVDFGNNINGEGLKGSNFTITRANMYGGKRQVWCDSCTLQDSFLHDQLSDPSGVTHESSSRVESNATIRHNTLWCNAPDFPPDAGCSANQTGYPDFSAIHNNTFDKNFYMATTGGYCSYGGNNPGKPYNNDPLNATNIHSTNNVFQRGTKPNDRTTVALSDKRRYTCGYYGVTSSFLSSKSGFIFTGNMWDDGLLFSNDSTYPYGGFYE